MEYFRNFLIYIRKTENINPYKYKLSTISIFIAVIVSILGYVLDSFLPFNFILNGLRGIFALVAGTGFFVFIYLKTVVISNKKLRENPSYQRVRERFSHRQRINFSIIISAIIMLIVIIGELGPGYTLKSSLAVTGFISLIAFARSRRSEFIKEVNNIPDLRDVKEERKKIQKFNQKKQNHLEKKAKKTEKKENKKSIFNRK